MQNIKLLAYLINFIKIFVMCDLKNPGLSFFSIKRIVIDALS